MLKSILFVIQEFKMQIIRYFPEVTGGLHFFF